MMVFSVQVDFGGKQRAGILTVSPGVIAGTRDARWYCYMKEHAQQAWTCLPGSTYSAQPLNKSSCFLGISLLYSTALQYSSLLWSQHACLQHNRLVTIVLFIVLPAPNADCSRHEDKIAQALAGQL
jgi:hypothetical protein